MYEAGAGQQGFGQGLPVHAIHPPKSPPRMVSGAYGCPKITCAKKDHVCQDAHVRRLPDRLQPSASPRHSHAGLALHSHKQPHSGVGQLLGHPDVGAPGQAAELGG